MSINIHNTGAVDKLNLSKTLSERLLAILEHEESFLKAENKNITGDSESVIDHDLKFIKSYLSEYVVNNGHVFEKTLKSKGKVFIILSYNEPFILNIIPILNALVAGNTLVIKPSSRCESFLKTVWIDSGMVDELDLPITIVNSPDEVKMKDIISQVDCVYFFGSSAVAKKIYKICAEYFVEFIPEVEAADCKVFKFSNPTGDFIDNDCKSTILQSITHVGQTCQRISGVLIHEDNFKEYRKRIVNVFNKFPNSEMNLLIDRTFEIDHAYEDQIMKDIESSIPEEVVKSEYNMAKLVINPDISSEFVKNGYFYPVLWLASFRDIDQLYTKLNSRRFFLGLNICSDDSSFVDSIINKTKFTRYTVNMSHHEVRTNEGWGGRWPSGSGGYKSWIEHFSVSFKALFGSDPTCDEFNDTL